MAFQKGGRMGERIRARSRGLKEQASLKHGCNITQQRMCFNLHAWSMVACQRLKTPILRIRFCALASSLPLSTTFFLLPWLTDDPLIAASFLCTRSHFNQKSGRMIRNLNPVVLVLMYARYVFLFTLSSSCCHRYQEPVMFCV